MASCITSNIQSGKNQHNTQFQAATKGSGGADFDKIYMWIDPPPKKTVALARKGTIPTERPLLVGEVSANFCG
jgi:hypothetical protein